MRPREEFTRDDDPLWALRLAELVALLGGTLPDPARLNARAEAWVLMSTALRRYLRNHASRTARMDPADLEDIASAKSLELLSRAESGEWEVHGARSGGEVAAYLSRVARNGLVDAVRARSRQATVEEELPVSDTWQGRPPPPESMVESGDFARALFACTQRLPPRSFIAWFLRVYYDMPTREIAIHPHVNLKPGHVDVILQRARDAISACMRGKGHEPAEMPAGTFVELWKRFRQIADSRTWKVPHEEPELDPGS